MPTTSPRALTSGPPELPDEIAASVWIKPVEERAVGADGAIERRHDAERDRRVAVEAERETDRDDLVAETDAVGIGEHGRVEVVAAHPQEREIVAGIGGEQPRLARFGFAGEPHTDLGRAVHDVGVGEDLAVGRDDHAGADRLATRRRRR